MKRVVALYFSPTGTTELLVKSLAKELAEKLLLPLMYVNFTEMAVREEGFRFQEEDLAVIGSPTYAGKLPNKILPDFQNRLQGNGARAVALVSFGNRSFDNSLKELSETLRRDGFVLTAAAAMACRHAFSDKVGTHRPDARDREELRVFAERILESLKEGDAAAELSPEKVPGDADAPYYVPKGIDGQPAKFLKAKPLTDKSKCTKCGICAASCPLQSISFEEVSEVPGICIKCQACVRKCPENAKYFDDEAFLSHVRMLEENFPEPKKNQFFL